MASSLRQLADADLEAIHHLIRRDAKTDLEIAQEAERRLGEPLAKSEHAKAMVIHRYRKSATYERWLKRWESQDIELRKAVETQKQRFELISKMVQGDCEEGLEAISKSLQARLLSLAAEADDEELKEAMAGRGWVKNLMAILQKVLHDRYRQQVMELKEHIRRLGEQRKGAGSELRYDEVLEQVDKIMGLT